MISHTATTRFARGSRSKCSYHFTALSIAGLKHHRGRHSTNRCTFLSQHAHSFSPQRYSVTFLQHYQKKPVSPLAIAVGCSNIYLSCHSRTQACQNTVPEALRTPTWPMYCLSDLKVHSSDPSATTPTSSLVLQQGMLCSPPSTTSQPAMLLLALCIPSVQTPVVLGLIGMRTPHR